MKQKRYICVASCFATMTKFDQTKYNIVAECVCDTGT